MRFALSVFILALGLAGCRKTDGPLLRPDLTGRNARILATTGMIADAVREIGGDHVDVECLMGPGVDPHTFVASPRDLARIEEADLVLYNGLHLEGKMSDLFEDRARSSWTIAVAEGLSNLRDAEEGVHDPHVWFDVAMWMKVVERIRDVLIDLDPAHAEVYRSRASSYLRELEALDKEVREKIQRIPPGRRVLITAHDAFGYYGRAYGLEVRGLQGVSTATDTSGRDVAELAEVIGTRGIRAVFAETSVPSKGVQAVIRAVHTKFKGHEVKLAPEELYSDSLGPPGTPGERYAGMVRHNTDVIVRALSDERSPSP